MIRIDLSLNRDKIYIFCLSTFIILVTSIPSQTYAWGKKGHDIVCYIAECHLNESAKERVTEILGGRSMVYYGSWMDHASHTKEYAHTKPWHYMNMGLREQVDSAKRSRDGDLLSALPQIELSLRSGSLSLEEEAVALKMFIHLVADLHQPMHIGRADDSGGNKIPVVYFVESTNLHALWDYHLVEGCHSWSYTEWQQQIDRLSEVARLNVVVGDYATWIESTHDITRQIYRTTPVESRIFYEYVDRFTPIVEQQLLYAGLRLASLLNDILGK